MTQDEARHVAFGRLALRDLYPQLSEDIGLWGKGVQQAFADMGAIEFAEVDSEALLEQDHRVAAEFDAGHFVRESLA